MNASEQTAREQLWAALYAARWGKGGSGMSTERMLDAVLDNLPVVLAAAQEAGKARSVETLNGKGTPVWVLLEERS